MAKTLTGTVMSDKVDKTIVVKISSRLTHPVYKKQYSVSKKVMAHDADNQAKIGDVVVIVETKPLSAKKRFTLKKVVERAAIEHVEPDLDLPEKEKPVEKPAKKAEKSEEPKEKAE